MLPAHGSFFFWLTHLTKGLSEDTESGKYTFQSDLFRNKSKPTLS